MSRSEPLVRSLSALLSDAAVSLGVLPARGSSKTYSIITQGSLMSSGVGGAAPQASAAWSTATAAGGSRLAVGRRQRPFVTAAAAASGWRKPGPGTAGFHAPVAAEPAPLSQLEGVGSVGSSSSVVATPAVPRVALTSADADVGAAHVRQPNMDGGVGAEPQAAVTTADDMCVEGTVQKITFRAEDTAYTVMRVQLSAPVKAAPASGTAVSKSSALGKKRVITVVGNLPQVAVGQALRLRGSWVEHKQYGLQLRATDLEELSPSTEGEMVAYLSGGAIAGVGPVTAQRMVARWGTEIEARLNSRSAVRYLVQCNGISAAKAEKIKAAWDATKGTREGVMFLKEHGVPLPLAQRIANRWGLHTVERVQGDPYAALAGSGLPFSKVDQLAAKVGAPADLVSRAAMAVQQCLAAAAAQEGHTYLPWHRLERDCGRMLEEAGRHHGTPWHHDAALHVVAKHMHVCGALVAEPADSSAAAAAVAAADAEAFGGGHAAWAGQAEASHSDPSQGLDGAGERATLTAPAPARTHPEFHGDVDSLRDYLAGKLAGVRGNTLDAVIASFGERALSVLDDDFDGAVGRLCKCRGVGPKTAEKVKLAWEAAHGNATAALAAAAGEGTIGTAGSAGLGSTPGLTMQQLLDAPPAVPFAWGPATRCYSPHLHAAEQTVAQRCLQRAAAYTPSSARQLSRVRKWVEANQANSQSTSAAGADIQLNTGQVRAIEVASDAPLMVLTGGPGCGKTTAVQTIVKLWCAQGKMVRIAAPTGRAAQRMGAIQGIEPCTIHRLLGYQPRGSGDGGDAGGKGGAAGSSAGALLDLDAAMEETRLGTQGAFTYNRSNPLPADAVLVDEASMLSLPLAAALVDALRPKCQLVLVGDVDQLPPVGPGAVLQSLIASRLVPVVDLREIFRQAAESAIVTSALAVRRGDVPILQPVSADAGALGAATSDALLVHADGPEELPAAVRDAVVAMRQVHGYRGGSPGEEGDLQVLSPMRKGPAGTSALNPMLQALLNPAVPGKAELPRHHSPAAGAATHSASQHGGRVFRVGDRVIQLVNNYDKDVFNGDQGRVVRCHPEDRKLVVHFPHLEREGGGVGGERSYQGVELGQLELAYAITVHKAQGGEAPHVVLALSPAHGRMLTRRLLYTGLTRAKRQLVVVSAGGATDPLAKAVRCKESEVRLASLQARLEQGREAGALQERPPELFSNEEQMLQQAAQWQAQAAERAARERREAAEAAAAAEAGHLSADWAARQPWAAQPALPGEQQVAAAVAALQAEGVAAPQAAELAATLQQRCPEALLRWERSAEALAWLRRECGEELTLESVVRRAPLLLGMSESSLARTLRFVAARDMQRRADASFSDEESDDDGSGGARSAVQGLLCLLAMQAGSGVAQQQQQAPAG